MRKNDFQPGKTYGVSVSEILTNWFPGDFMSSTCECEIIHTCVSLDKQWSQIASFVTADEDRYIEIFKSIKNKGFVAPVRAVSADDKMLLFDGHHRINIALDLRIDIVPVYIAKELDVAPDSGWWRDSNQPWISVD